MRRTGGTPRASRYSDRPPLGRCSSNGPPRHRADLDDLLELASARRARARRLHPPHGGGRAGLQGAARSDRRRLGAAHPTPQQTCSSAPIRGAPAGAVARGPMYPCRHWRIQTPQLIAYPLLPEIPGLTVGGDGTLTWNIDDSLACRTRRPSGTPWRSCDAVEGVIAAARLGVHSPAEVWTRELEGTAPTRGTGSERHGSSRSSTPTMRWTLGRRCLSGPRASKTAHATAKSTRGAVPRMEAIACCGRTVGLGTRQRGLRAI